MLAKAANIIVYDVLSLQGSLGEAVHFFVYDSIKIIALLFAMITVVGVGRTYISPQRIKKMLSRRSAVSYLSAAAMGAFTPFCSCSSIPVFIGFLKAGVSMGPAFTFLITSPLINEYLAVLMLSYFGWKITAVYVAFGLALGITAGKVIDAADLEDEIVQDMRGQELQDTKYERFKDRVDYGVGEAKTIVARIWLWVLAGVAVGAAIHGFIPDQVIEKVLEGAGPFSVPLAALIGMPVYANCAAVVPIAVVLFNKGVPVGTALAFMMATSALSLPEAVILRRAMKLRLIIVFFALVGAGIVTVGYAFNVLKPLLGF